jgi:exopolyphosphatase/guanosine-5'-triphosphate,3'-diphosphate pyrophosphatase
MRLAIIDLGTNSVRFDVFESSGSGIIQLEKQRDMIRLGEDLFLTGALSTRAISRALESLANYKRACDDLQVDRIFAVGTSAMREAKNADELVRSAKKAVGLELEIISGPEEAKLIAEGILANEPKVEGKFLLVDIGGGSAEISVVVKKSVSKAASLPLGALRLQQLFCRSGPPISPDKEDQARSFIRESIAKAFPAAPYYPLKLAIGSSGSVRALAKIRPEDKEEKSFSAYHLLELLREMRPLGFDGLCKLPGMEAKRADIVYVGALALYEILIYFGIEEVVASKFSLRHGILARELKKKR